MTAATEFKEAHRAQLSVLAPLEKRTLIWLAQRLPASINSDHLTFVGLVSLVFAGVSYCFAAIDPRALHLVNVFLLTNWFGDSLDGTVARVRGHLRPRYGFYVDHMVDALGTLCLVGGLACSTYMSPAVAVGIILAYFLLTIEVYLTTYTIGTFQLSAWKLSPTELRLLLIAGNLYVFWRPDAVVLFGRPFQLFDVGGVVGIIGMAAMLVDKIARHTAQLYREEKLP